jgi:threonine dehydrogenase-like Zn-dependent dehydrogenase
MRAVCWEGKEKIQVKTVPDPAILNPRDAIVKVTTTAICGSDLRIYDGYIPTMQKGDVLGHEFMGEVVDVGKDNTRLKVGDRVVVPFTIACGRCYFCKEQLWSLCDNSNPNDPADVARVGFDAMMRGDGDVVSGWKNKLQSAIANITPAGVLAEQHRKMAEPGSGQKAKG